MTYFKKIRIILGCMTIEGKDLVPFYGFGRRRRRVRGELDELYNNRMRFRQYEVETPQDFERISQQVRWGVVHDKIIPGEEMAFLVYHVVAANFTMDVLTALYKTLYG